eukprot:CAMPEP_0172496982 /NCGR_PEP_ID=MMETSP1066-20121228/94726_1 /TAXON_ID=671091 /ORGANISM="Coscinodiscus wailesii, Strain CCMP2513" /LENGTH=222 /DNA_ID=CAMNT_0013269549 /DNA_START=198 /DNA_END=866 /DNA_ORIENTATION=+
MTIVYALVSRQKTVLAEHTSTSATGNFPTVTRVLLAKIPTVDGKMSYVYDQYVFHYIVENGICYLCMSDELNKHRLPYAFLQELKANFVAMYGTERPQTAIAFSFNDRFSKVIKERMDYYNSDNPNVDNISTVKGQIEEVKDVMVQNIEKVLERGEKIELLVDKTDRLNQQAFRFEKTSRTLRRTLWWKKVRTIVCMISLVAVVAFIIAAASCGGLDFHKCK